MPKRLTSVRLVLKKLTNVRQNIAIPANVKRRMDRVREPVDWSAVAAQAFEAKLDELAAGIEGRMLHEVIERLRASKAQLQNGDFREGRIAGRKWAEKHADARQLLRLARWRDRTGHAWEDCFITVRGQAFCAGEIFAGTIIGEDANRQSMRDFWTSALPNYDKRHGRYTNDDFVRGFAEGALDVWDRVKDKL
jgi:hypothetical protein